MPSRWLRRVLTVVCVACLLLLCLCIIVALPVMAHGPWPLAIVAVVLVGLFRIPAVARFRRARWLFAGLFACWIGLLAWFQFGPDGALPAAKADPTLIRIVTWNIHCGQDDGAPWERFDWPARKRALQAALEQALPDILCVQEARPGQVEFLEGMLPHHERIGVGRDDGRDGGEHCAIYFDRARFERLAGGTFWLEEPIDAPRPGSAFGVKRICTWVRLRDRDSNQVVRLYNSHFPLTEGAGHEAARVLQQQIAAGESSDVVVLTADFNAPPTARCRRLFVDGGLADSAALAGESPNQRTLHFYGIPIRSLDGILVGAGARVERRLLLDAKPGHVYPSDHFGLLADLALSRKGV